MSPNLADSDKKAKEHIITWHQNEHIGYRIEDPFKGMKRNQLCREMKKQTETNRVNP
jgi:hypothetical protein